MKRILLLPLWVSGSCAALEDAAWMEEALGASSLTLEVEAMGSSVAGEPASDLVFATVDWETAFSTSDWVQWHLGLRWEQDSREDDPLDRLYVRGAWNQVGWTVGRFYQPFGRFDSMFISDPLTLELGEINQMSLMVDARVGSLLPQVGLFRSSLDVEDERGLEEGYAALTWEMSESVTVGGFWLSNLLEADGLTELGSALAGANQLAESAGWGGFAAVTVGDVALSAEWLGAVDSVSRGADEQQPSAWEVECRCMLVERWSAGVRYERSDDFFAGFEKGDWVAPFAEKRLGAVVACEFDAGLSAALEVMQVAFADGTDGERVAFQLAQSF